MSSVTAASEATAPPDTTAPGSHLRGNLGTTHLFFTVLAFNAPLAIVVGFIPVIIGAGNGVGAPAALLVAGAIIGVFAVGFIAMSRHLPKPGGFYAYITAGLGRAVGLGASFVALVSYYFMLIGSYAFGGIAMESLVRDTFHGPDIAWWVGVMVLQLAAGVLGYFKLDLSARVLSVLLVCEVIMVLVYDAFVVFKGGAGGLGVESFTPHAMFSGSVGIALLFSLTMFGGFEATIIFRDEVRKPERTIPRATYLVVGFVTLVYVVGAWVMIQAYGPGHVVAAAAADPTGSFLSSLQTYVGRVAVDMVTVLLNTSIFAAVLSAHNITSRYLYNLSADRILPGSLSHVHGRHGSPHRSSLAISALALVGMAPLAIFKANPATLYAILIGIYGYTFIILLLVTTVAVVVYLKRHKPAGVNNWQSLIAPILAFVGLGVSAYLATLNFDLLISGSKTLAVTILLAIYGLAVAGVVLALVYRRTRPDTYARIGRQ
jgi:amino acid transporter